MTTLGAATLTMENPAIGKLGFAFPTFRWVGWMVFIYGILIILTSIHDLFFNRKKRLAALAKCKTIREQEAEAAQNEDNQ